MARRYRQFAITTIQPSIAHVTIFASRVVLETRTKGASLFFYSGKRLIGIVDPRSVNVREFVNDRTVPLQEVEGIKQFDISMGEVSRG